MFYIINLEDNIALEPKFISKNISLILKNYLITLYKNKVIGKINAYIIDILDIDNIIEGEIDNITGNITYSVKYTASIFKPIKGQNINIKINYINNIGIWGVLDVLPNSNIECFIPKSYLHNFKYIDSLNEWVNSSQEITINSIINVSIINLQLEINKIILVGKYNFI